jgi:hypothetical protein
MTSNSILIYDIEIKKAIPVDGQPRIEGIEYCEGWHDTANMGVSCICGYSLKEYKPFIWMDDNLFDFLKEVECHAFIAGFNNIGFDNEVLAYEFSGGKAIVRNGIIDLLNQKSYDIKRELADAVDVHYGKNGISLENTSRMNFHETYLKNGNGALAPVLYQKKEFGQLITYCMNDVRITSAIMTAILNDGELIHPLTGTRKKIDPPFNLKNITTL